MSTVLLPLTTGKMLKLDTYKEAHRRRGFAESENLSNIETERSRIVLQEVEEGWWVLAVCLSF